MPSKDILCGVLLALVLGCSAPAPSAATSTPVAVATAAPTPTRALAVAVPVGSPTPTVQLSGDYASAVRAPVLAIKDGLSRLEAQLAAAQKAPLLMAQDDWRNQTRTILQDLLGASGDLRSVNARITTSSPLRPETMKVADDVDFVANEFRMAFDYDPDATHLIRASRAEKTTSDEVDSLVQELH